MESRLLSVDEVAVFLHVEPPIVLKLIADGLLRAYRINTEYRLSKSQIDAYLDAIEVTSKRESDDRSMRISDAVSLPQALPLRYERDDFHTTAEFRENLWAFLNEPATIATMIAASDRDRPAAEAIADTLLQRFGRNIKRDEVKKRIGRLIKQVMETHGYDHVARGERCRPNPVFSVASRYRRVV